MTFNLQTDRRRLLQLAATSATCLWLPRSAWSQARWQADPFALGVASGSPTHESVVLWTRLAHDAAGHENQALPSPVTVRWEVARDAGFSRIVRSGQAQAWADLGHAVHVEVGGLEPDRWYHYRFMAGDAISPVGRTRTFPEPGADAQRLRLAYASCQRWEHGYYSAWRHMRDDQPDVVLFLGDYLYEYPGALQAVRAVTGGWVLSLDDYRRRYALHRSDPDLQAMHAACPWLLTWDDHEVQNDYAGLTEGSGVPLLGTVADFAARRAAAYQAWYEHMPVPASVLTQAVQGLARGAEMRICGQTQFGRLATLHLLDSRQYRDPQVCTRGGLPGASLVDPAQCPAWQDSQRQYLGAAQERWLQGALNRSTTQWNLLGQQTLFGPRDARPGPGRSLWNDGWDGYSAARSRLLGMLQHSRVRNPVFLGGDVHENWVGHVKADYDQPGSASIGVEFCGTSITSRSGGADRVAERLSENPHFVFADAQHRGYGLADFTPRQMSAQLRVVSDATRADATVRTLASFTVPSGRAVVERSS